MQHPNARLSVYQRALIVRRVASGWTVTRAACAAGVSRQTASKWVNRFRRSESLEDGSCRPHSPHRSVDADTVRRVARARLRFRRGSRFLGWMLGLASSTVHRILCRLGLNRLHRISQQPVQRYEWDSPGDLIHLDIKKLGRIGEGGGKRVHGPSNDVRFRGIGWEYVHVAVDDRSRLAYAEIHPDETAASVATFTANAIDYFEAAGMTVRRVLTDNGPGYRSHAFRDLLADRGVSMRKTRPYRPQTNGKAEAFVKIVSNEWAYARAYRNTKERAEALGPFLRYYNLFRPHGGIGGQRPIMRVQP